MTESAAGRDVIAAVDFATLAREIAQDIFDVGDIIALHQLSDEEWQKISSHPRFVAMLGEMQRSWNSAENTRERIRIKAQTGLETQLETLIRDISDAGIPLTQRVDAGRFLARLGELDGQGKVGPGDGTPVQIVLNIGTMPPVTLTATPVIDARTSAIPE